MIVDWKMDSPRNVTAADRFAFEFSTSTHAFPTAVFAGAGGPAQYFAPTKAKRSHGKVPSSYSCLDLMPCLDGGGQTTEVPRLRPRKSRKNAFVWFWGRMQVSQLTLTPFDISTHVHEGTSGSQILRSRVLQGPVTTSARGAQTNMSCDAVVASKPMKTPMASEERPKSSAIAISKNACVDCYHENDRPSASLERLYDYATWQMYTRITNYRQRYPCRQPYTHEPACVPSSARPAAEGYHNEASSGSTTKAKHHVQFLDGEIFELEL